MLMGFFHKEHKVKEVEKEPIHKYIAPYQYNAIIFEILNSIAVKMDMEKELTTIKNKWEITEREHFKANMPNIDYDRFLRNGRKMY